MTRRKAQLSLVLALTASLAGCDRPSPPSVAPAEAAASPVEAESSAIPLGVQYQLTSAILGDTRQINVWVPPGHDGRRARENAGPSSSGCASPGRCAGFD